MPAASPRTFRCSEECTCWLDRYTYSVRDTVRQKLVVGVTITSTLIDVHLRLNGYNTNNRLLPYHVILTINTFLMINCNH